ncbi:protein-glutamate O-methyltransferase [Chitinispirillales bacterium ANBcel5]|uniref:CheR family methyltransferase n=1 Tax=Cellulosispirillum alkaliphilum TaxID=3039283 RepID=UPI002A535D8C|nr:protein-glutamate O-methyltransferase [Chitinispirillales bacterium ANBcel5]
MEQKYFKKLCDFIYEQSGISLTEKKEALVNTRISKRMRAHGIDNVKEYIDLITNDSSGNEIIQLLDVISTNVTHFFRENVHFEFLTEKMKEWLSEGNRRFRFWSAGCSSGEEPYSLAITLSEVIGENNIDTKILATDISTRILEKANNGVYESDKVANVPKLYKSRYFINNTNVFSVKDSIRSTIVFRRLNLSKVPFPMNGPMDVIFCRNVMIYFDNYIREKLIKEFYRLLKPGGYLFVGHSESLTGLLSGMKAVKPSIYIKE